MSIDYPKQWHVYTVRLEPADKSKPGKQRPCLAVQPSEFAEGGLESTVILPITTRVTHGDAFPLRVRLEKGVGGLQQESEILIDQILAWHNSFFVTELGRLPEALIEQVQLALLEFLDLASYVK